MTEQRFGKIIARGSDAFVALVGLALDECVNQDIRNLPARDFTIEEHTPAEFRAAGYIIKATGDTAEGHVVGGHKLWINSRTVAGRPKRARHIVRHEIGHVVPLTDSKRTGLMSLMLTATDAHPTVWAGGGYLSKPYECFADTFAEAVSGQDSPWDDFAFYLLDVPDADVPKLLAVAMRVDVKPPLPPVTPDPLPPTDPKVAVLTAENATLKTKISLAQAALE